MQPHTLAPAPCARCGYTLEGLVIDTAKGGAPAREWKAICPECGHDNFGPLPPEVLGRSRAIRRWRWLFRGLGILLALVVVWLIGARFAP